MEKFVIKNADGSEQNVIPAVHNSHKSARNLELYEGQYCPYGK